jgi:ATP-binding cassette subfamily F protein 3
VSHDRVLLRALTTRVWILHEGRITDYPGSFEEWEAASRERAHAAAVAAAEEESLRKVKERKQSRPADPGKDRQADRRDAERAVGEAEAEVSAWEARVEGLRAMLEDPHLYVTPDGGRRAAELGRELEQARGGLDEAFARWEAATRSAEAIR